MKVTVIPIVIGAIGTVTEGLLKKTGRLRNKGSSEDNPNYSIVKIGQNTEKCPGDLGKLVVTQTQVKDHQLTLMRKTLKE